MPYKLDVLVEYRVILNTVEGYYSIDEMIQACLEVASFFNTCTDKGGISLLNMTKAKSVERNLVQVRDATKPVLEHPNLLLAVSYGTSDKVVVNFLVNSLAGLFRQPAKSFVSEAEAVKFTIAKCPELAESLPQALKEFHLREG